MRIHLLTGVSVVAMVAAAMSIAAAGPPQLIAPPHPAAPNATAPSGQSSAPAGIVRVKLWEKTPDVIEGSDREVDPTEPTYDIYLPPADKANGTGMLVFPGGSYSTLSMTKEGSDMAKMLASHDIAAFVVRYRHAPRYHAPTPLMDGQRALRTVRSKAAEYHLDPNRIGVMGFSAGGHLAASVATMFDDGPAVESPDAIDRLSARPDFAVLMYPVINLTDDAVTHQPSRAALSGDNPALYAALSADQHVTDKTPPIFIVHGTNDRTVPVMNSILFYEACVKAKVPAELHVFENGPHGFGLGGNDAGLKTWPDQLMRWMGRHKWLIAAVK